MNPIRDLIEHINGELDARLPPDSPPLEDDARQVAATVVGAPLAPTSNVEQPSFDERGEISKRHIDALKAARKTKPRNVTSTA